MVDIDVDEFAMKEEAVGLQKYQDMPIIEIFEDGIGTNAQTLHELQAQYTTLKQ